MKSRSLVDSVHSTSLITILTPISKLSCDASKSSLLWELNIRPLEQVVKAPIALVILLKKARTLDIAMNTSHQ